jgi:hypothetical protein
LINVDHVHAEATEARVASGSDSVRGQSLAARVGHTEAHFRRKHDFIAVPGQPRCESALGLSIAVDVGGVDERAAGFEESVQHPVGLLGRGRSAHQHRAQAKPANG